VDKRKFKIDDARLDDRWIRKAERRGPAA